MRNQRLACLAVSALGAAVVWFATANGVGISRDSMTYVRGAENIAHGNGYSVVSEAGGLESVMHWPPLYSMVVSVPIRAGLSATNSVRLVNAVSLFVLLLLAASLVRQLAPDARTAPVLAAVVLLVMPDIVQNFVMAWSEALFLPLLLFAFVKMLDYTERGRRRDLLLAAAGFGLTAVTRYSGAAFVAGALAWLLLVDRSVGRWARERLVRVIAFGVVAGIPTVLLFVRNYFATNQAHDRSFDPRFFSVEHVRTAAESVTRWVLPSSVPLRFRLAWLVVVAVLLILSVRSNREATRRIVADLARHGRFWTFAAVSVVTYVGFVKVTILFFDYDVQFDPRMMSPVLVLLVVFLAVTARGVLKRPRGVPAILAAGAMVVSIAFLTADSVRRLRAAHAEPAQFASDKWTQARAWEILRADPDAAVYSTSPFAGKYFLSRPVQPFSAANVTEDAYLLLHPTLDGARLDANTRASLGARMIDSTDVVILYSLSK